MTSASPSTPSARYRSLERLAKGGMGEVELAVRTEGQFRRLYAVKRLHESMREDESARSMFLDEARLAGLVRHPNVVSVLDVGEDERGPFLVMDFVEGISAGSLLSWCGKSGVTLPVQLCLRLVREIALGLHAAHELTDDDGQPLGLVHRDVSPQNILVGFDGIARIADFGIAKAAGRTTRTTTGLLKGKAGYMSPEQLRFEEPDRRSDLFSLAIVLYELLAGARLYKSENDIASARRILNEPPPDIDDARDDVPPEVVELLFSSLAKDPAARPASAQEVAQRLDRSIAALVEAEGPLDVGEYVREHFAERRAQLAARLTDLRARATVPTGEPVAVASAAHAPTAPRRHSIVAWAVAAIVVAALSASLAIELSRASRAPDDITVTTLPAGSAPASDVPPPLAAPPAASLVAAPASPDGDAPGEDEAARASASPDEARPSRPRRPGARRARPRDAPAGEQLFQWE